MNISSQVRREKKDSCSSSGLEKFKLQVEGNNASARKCPVRLKRREAAGESRQPVQVDRPDPLLTPNEFRREGEHWEMRSYKYWHESWCCVALTLKVMV
jgi:hypothetical protein